jgi:hypothetical protein
MDKMYLIYGNTWVFEINESLQDEFLEASKSPDSGYLDSLVSQVKSEQMPVKPDIKMQGTFIFVDWNE